MRTSQEKRPADVPSGRTEPEFRLDVRPPTAGERDALEAFIERCSDESIYRRFHSGGRGRTVRLEVDRWVDAPPDYLTVIAAECAHHSCAQPSNVPADDLWVHGVANLAVSRDGSAEIAILVEDTWRRMGVATRLIWTLAGLAAARGLCEVTVDIQPDNRPAIDLLNALSTDYVVVSTGADLRAVVPTPRSRGGRFNRPHQDAGAPAPSPTPTPT